MSNPNEVELANAGLLAITAVVDTTGNVESSCVQSMVHGNQRRSTWEPVVEQPYCTTQARSSVELADDQTGSSGGLQYTEVGM